MRSLVPGYRERLTGWSCPETSRTASEIGVLSGLDRFVVALCCTGKAGKDDFHIRPSSTEEPTMATRPSRSSQVKRCYPSRNACIYVPTSKCQRHAVEIGGRSRSRRPEILKRPDLEDVSSLTRVRETRAQTVMKSTPQHLSSYMKATCMHARYMALSNSIRAECNDAIFQVCRVLQEDRPSGFLVQVRQGVVRSAQASIRARMHVRSQGCSTSTSQQAEPASGCGKGGQDHQRCVDEIRPQ